MSFRGAHGLAEFFLFSNFLAAIEGVSQLTGPSEPVQGLVGDDVILPCSLQPAESVTEKTVEWTRPDLNPSSVHILRQGHLLDQNLSFLQRTSLFRQELKNGNVSLKLRRLKLADEGTYKCKVVTSESETFIQVRLVVGAVSEPKISIESTDGIRLVLKCDAENWYPEPEMEWRDREGRIIPQDSNSTECDIYYSAHSRITVEMTTNDIYTCTVLQQDIRQSRETNYTIPHIYKEFISLKESKSGLEASLGVCGMVIAGLFLGILMYMCARRFQCVRKTDEPDGVEMERQENEVGDPQERLLQQNQALEDEVRRLRRENEALRRLLCCSHVRADNEPQ